MARIQGGGRLLAALVIGTAAVGVLAPGNVQALGATPMKIRIDLSNSADRLVQLPFRGIGNVQISVNWGGSCGTVSYPSAGVGPLNNETISCTYTAGDVTAGALKTIEVAWLAGAAVELFGGEQTTTGASLFEAVLDWGDLGLGSLYGAFRGMTNLVDVPGTLPGTVTDLSYAFFGATSFNDPIGNWDVSNVANTYSMFSGATAFNQPIGNWDTSGVINMARMFEGAISFDQDLSTSQTITGWDTSSANFMDAMFLGATSFDGDVSGWDVSNVVVMNDMFKGASNFNSNISSWDVSNVIDMRSMFENALFFNQNVSGWTVTDLALASNMFRGATSFNYGCAPGPCADAFSWPNAPALTQIAGMFADATAFNARVVIDTDQVTSFAEMFWGATSYNNGCATDLFTAQAAPCLLALTTPVLTTTAQMFEGATNFNQRVTFTSTAGITSIGRMFAGALRFNNGCAPGIVLCPFNFGRVAPQQNFGALTAAGGAFAGAGAFNQNLNSWNMSTVVTTSAMFYNQGSFNNGCLTSDPSCPLTWTTTSLVTMDEMFTGAVDFDQALPNFDTRNVTTMIDLFRSATSFDQDISGWNVRRVVNMARMFEGAMRFDQDLSSWCFDGQVNNFHFALGAGFELLTAKHPAWNGCPTPVVIAPVVAPPATTTTPPATPAPVDPSVPVVPPTLPETGAESTLGLVALWLLVMGVIVGRLRLPSRR